MYLLNLSRVTHIRKGVFYFTFHNVSIKSASYTINSSATKNFTFHNVSIKSPSTIFSRNTSSVFTFHNVSIKSLSHHAHFIDRFSFTFHNVSIKSTRRCTVQIMDSALHSTMYLLNPCEKMKRISEILPLHSTMYLLNRSPNFFIDPLR